MAFLSDQDKDFISRIADEGNENPPKAAWRKLVCLNCKDCIYDPEAGGTWRQQVADCAVTACPLHPIRPRSTK